jgi:hypothetical protein
MAINFPAGPAVNDLYTLGSRTWKWNGAGWEAVSTGYGPTGATGPSGSPLPNIDTIGYSTPLTIDCSLRDIAQITLTGNITITFSNAVDGQVIRLRLYQDSVGSRTLTLGTGIRVGTDITGVTLSTTAYACDYIAFIYNATDSKYDLLSYARGYV